jgi:hypothetical protein
MKQNLTTNKQPPNTTRNSEEKVEKSLFDNIIDFFRLDNKEKKPDIKIQNIRGGYIKCECPKTHSKYYCDNIYEILKMVKKNDIDSERNIKLYQGLLRIHDRKLDTNGENIIQIKKDLHRTFPSSLIMKTERIQNKLKNVLRAFSNYEPKVKYYQGMNFIVGFFLFHCDEHVAFWLFVSLFEEYDYRTIFMNDFSGLKYHVEKVQTILKKYNSKLYEDLTKCGVNFEIFMIEWLYSLFSSIIPLELQMNFYKGFFCEGFKFFYKMCISIITSAKGNFNGPEELYIVFKFGTLDEKVTQEFTNEYWKKIIHNAYFIDIDDCL